MTPYDAPARRKSQRPRAPGRLIDGFGRTVTYLRVSVTDRCDLRCVYCMAEHMTFLPEGRRCCRWRSWTAWPRPSSALGVRKLRLTGGEPLVRKGDHGPGGAPVAASAPAAPGRTDPDHQRHPAGRVHAADLARLGVRRINVSLDTLKPDLFRKLTRGGDLAKVLAGIDAALAAGDRR